MVFATLWQITGLSILSTIFVYLYKLSNRIRGPHTFTRPNTPLSRDQLAQVVYKNIDLLNAIPTRPTSSGYAVVGGSGFLGTYIIRLLLLRGETNVRILDQHPPSEKIVSHTSVSFIKTDITSLQSVRAALSLPFDTTGSPPTIIYHTAAIIRFWERLSYCWNASYNVNVLGLQNVITVANELPSAVLVYTSTADTAIPCPKFLRLGWDLPTSNNDNYSVSDFDEPLPDAQLSESCYSRTKLLAEHLVKKADSPSGLRTGIIRPGYTIMGPNDRLITSTLTMPRVPVWDKHWSSTNICVWDAAAAHLLLEDALTRNAEGARGQAFFVTGKDPAWRLQDTRDAVKFYATRNIILDDVPPLAMYILAHLIEAFLFLRYHVLLYLYLPFGARPSIIPRWMGQVVYLQPATLEYLNDITIDDSRARKVLGYRPQWGTAQCIRYTVDEVQSGNVGTNHGLQLKSS